MQSRESVIQARNITRVFSTGSTQVQALQGIDLDISRGEMIAIMGASGSGKSTLMHILGCLDYPSSGIYTLDGMRVDQMNRNQLADVRNQKIGFVFQGFNLLSRTSAVENVELPLLYSRGGKYHHSRRLAVDALKRVGLENRLDHKPNELSGGQQQRVAIARALVTQPAILLADEPTGNLDTRTSLEVLTLFQALNAEGITILLITHEQDIARYAKRLIELRDGRIIRDECLASMASATVDLQRMPTSENAKVSI